MKKFTDAQFKILLSEDRSARYTSAEGHGEERAATHVGYMIPVFGSGENRSARSMEAKGWGYMSSKAPFNHMFFRPVKGLLIDANQALQNMERWDRPSIY